MICSEASLVNSDGKSGQAVTLRCKRWHCEICRPHNRWAVIKKAEAGKPTTFMTLTCQPSRYETPDEAARDMKRALVLLRRHLKEKKGIEKVPFIVVFERTQSGWPHMHLLVRAPYVHWKWLSLEMKRLIGAQSIDIRRVGKRKGAAYYISKYIGKDPEAFKGCKRWWRSHNYDLSEDDDSEPLRYGYRWNEAPVTLSRYAEILEDQGAIIVEQRRGYLRWEEGHEGQVFKPRSITIAERLKSSRLERLREYRRA